MGKWLAGIIATVIAGVLVFWLTQGLRSPSTPPPPNQSPSGGPIAVRCIEQLEEGYRLKESIEKEYRLSRRNENWAVAQDELISEWKKKVGSWITETEELLQRSGGTLLRGRFRNARGPSTVRAGENFKWSGLDNLLQGKLQALDKICQQMRS